MVELLIVALAIFGFAMFSKRLELSAVTAPMVFTTVGMIVGTGGFGWFDLELESEAVSVLVEATLVLVLFTDAVRIDLRVLLRRAAIPTRLLGIGFPLTILAGVGAGMLIFPDLGTAEVALLAAILAPTDAALGQAVVSDPRLPMRIRQALNVESGLNDGIAVPVVTVLLAVVLSETGGGASDWVTLAAREVGFGVLAGVLIGGLGGKLLDLRSEAGAVQGVYRQLAALAVAIGAFALAGVLDGNGFIGAFTAGLTFGQIAGRQCDTVQDFTEDEGELLSAVTFLVFGSLVVGPVLGDVTWQTIAYATASLTVVRVVPVLLAMIGSGTQFETRLFLAWFGPRGLASILFALLVVDAMDSPTGQMVFTVAAWTVLASVFLHGITASAWAGRLGQRLAGEVEPPVEMEPTLDLPTRRRL